MNTDAAGKTLATIRIVNGQVQIDYPDNPETLEGPSRFTDFMTPDEFGRLYATLDDNGRSRVRSLINDHMKELERVTHAATSMVDRARARAEQGRAIANLVRR